MSNYTPSTDFAAKDTMLSGNPNKIVKGTEISAELTSIAAAVSSKADSSSANAFTAGATTLGATTATSLNSTPIGATTPSTGAFTSISATGTVLTSSTASSAFGIVGAGSNSQSAFILRNTTAGQASPGAYFYNGDGYRFSIQNGVGAAGLSITSHDAAPVNIAANLAVTGALSATGNIVVTKATGVPKLQLIASTGTNEAYSQITSSGGSYYFGVENSAGSWFGATAYAGVIQAPAGRVIQQLISATPITTVSSTGLAVTGTLSATQSTSGVGGWKVASTLSATDYPLLRFEASGVNKWSSIGNNADGSLQFLVNGTSGAVGTTAAVLDTTGLAVTGALSATGQVSASNSAGFFLNEAGVRSWTINATSGNLNIQAGDTLGAIGFNSGKMTLDASGNFLVGTTTNSSSNTNSVNIAVATGAVGTSHASGTASGTLYVNFNYNATQIGSITQNGTTAVAYNTTSDHRLKENVRPADAARFMDIEFVDFEWTDGRHDCGVIAHQLQSVYPDLVIGAKDATEVRTVEITPAVPAVLDDEGNEVTPEVPAVTEEQTFPVYQQVNYIGLIGRMGTRIQQLQRTVDAMEARLAALEAQ